MSLKTSKIATSAKDRFIKGLTMALHSENIILSESERSLYEFILSRKNSMNNTYLGYKRRITPGKLYWSIWAAWERN
jgi:hypothetical protein